MTGEEKVKSFNTELDFIKNEDIKENGKILVQLLPEYFFNVAASSTGKYHPTFSLGEGGLLRHTKAAARIAKELLDLEMFQEAFNERERDLMILSIILHDGLKHGYDMSQYTVAEHPVYMANYVKENKDKLSLPEDEIEFISNCIATHMGQWNTDYKGNVIMDKPTSNQQKFVHMCDFLSSRKFLDVRFYPDNNIVG